MDIYSHEGKFNTSKYTTWYYSIIERAKSQDRKKQKGLYYESHHILPKSLFPEYTYIKDNKVLLTAKEHFIVHCLLTKMTTSKDKIKMLFALKYFKIHPKETFRYFNGKLYHKLKNNKKESYRLSDEHKTKISQKLIGIKRIPFSKEHRRKIGLAVSERIVTNITKEKLSSIRKGTIWINNGFINKRIKNNQIPEGWNRGRCKPSSIL